MVTELIYHVRKTSIGVKRKYHFYADNGEGKPGDELGYAEKQLKMTDEIVIYRDEERTQQVAVVRESSAGFLAALTGYETFDASGELLGSFGVLVKKSMKRTTWEFEQKGLGRFTGVERNLKTARFRRMISLGSGAAGEMVNAVIKYHFDFTGDSGPGFSIDKPKVLDDWYRLALKDEQFNPTLLFALAVTMEARQRG